jgi:hypothetical protein
VTQNGQCLAELKTRSLAEVEIETLPGTLEFSAEPLFEAEDTGEQIDIGGWLAIEPRSVSVAHALPPNKAG